MENTAVQDSLLPSVHHPIKLESFEGPLDLLLFLIRRNEIDIYDIPVEKVTSQYLEYLSSCKSKDLELTGEFFVMAATLMVIKSRMLLPKNEQPDQEDEEVEEEDPRWELVQQLLQYKRIKEEARKLEALIAENHDVLPRIASLKDLPKGTRPLKKTDQIELWNTFNKVLARLSEQMTVGEIHEEHHTVADRMSFIIDTLHHEPKFYFTELFKDKASVGIIVNTFLALLELTRLKILFLEQNENFDDILCQKREMPTSSHGDFAHLILESEPAQ